MLQFGVPFPTVFINPDDELGTIINSEADGEIGLLDIKGFRHPFTVDLFKAERVRKKVVRIVPTGQTFTMVERRGYLR
jgi:hypothetical protein